MAEKSLFLASFSGEIGTKRPATQADLKALVQENLKRRARALGFKLKLADFRGRLKIANKEPSSDQALERLLLTHPGLGKLAYFYQVDEKFSLVDLLPDRPFTFELYVTKWQDQGTKAKALEIKKDLLARLKEEAQRRLSGWDNHPVPHLSLELEAYEEGVFLLKNLAQPGARGLPVGSGGRGLVLFSGGPDSLLAVWLLLKRGLSLTLLFFSDGDPQRETLVQEAATNLAYFFPEGEVTLLTLAYRPFLEELKNAVPERERCLFCKALMLRLAERVLEKEGAEVLATGDVLGEQASQTLAALNFISQGRPVLRPVLAFAKEEIFETLYTLGLKEVATRALPSCPFAPKRPRTAPRKGPFKTEKILRKLGRKPLNLRRMTLKAKGAKP